MNDNKMQSVQDKSKGIVHIGIGVVYLILAGVIVYAEKNKYIDVGATFSYIMCGLFAIYGLFRIYRGYLRVKGREIGW